MDCRWPEPPSILDLERQGPAKESTDLWIVAGEGEDRSRDLFRLLDPAESAEAAKIKADHARALFTQTRVALRCILSAYVGVRPWQVLLQRDRRGRLFLGDKSGIDFSVSHTEGCIAIAVAGPGRIGVDVERIRSIDEPTLMWTAQRFFASEEIDALEALRGPSLITLFLELWTLKEAYLKCLGVGLAGSLRSASFTIAPLSVVHKDYLTSAPLRFSLGESADGLIVAVCEVLSGSKAAPTIRRACLAQDLTLDPRRESSFRFRESHIG